MKYLFKERDPINETRVIAVGKEGQPEWDWPEVWYDIAGDAWCSSCSGPISAMSRSCKHAKAVSRHMKSANQGPKP